MATGLLQDYFSSYETGQSVDGVKTREPRKNHLAHPEAELGLSHMRPKWGSIEPTPDTVLSEMHES